MFKSFANDTLFQKMKRHEKKHGYIVSECQCDIDKAAKIKCIQFTKLNTHENCKIYSNSALKIHKFCSFVHQYSKQEFVTVYINQEAKSALWKPQRKPAVWKNQEYSCHIHSNYIWQWWYCVLMQLSIKIRWQPTREQNNKQIRWQSYFCLWSCAREPATRLHEKNTGKQFAQV